MGEVWRAKDVRVDRDVALKVLPEEFFESEERRQRFGREARMLASLNHPGIATLYSFEEIPGSPPFSSRHLLVMELVESELRSDGMEDGKIPVDEALSIGRDIAAALEAAHAKGIVHRDLKPGNVMLTTDGRIKVLDFGLAKAFENAPSPDLFEAPTLTAAGTEAGVILGTPAYMSPEQACGQRVDARTDVWAFGVVLWELLAGKRLFHGGSTPDTLAAVLREPVNFRALPPSTPREVRDLLARCLEREPEKRLANIGEARRVLEKAEAGGVLSRVVWLRLAAGVGLLIVLAAAGVFLARRKPTPPAAPASIAPSIAVLPFTNLSGDKEQEFFSDGLTEEVMGLLTRIKGLKVTGRTSSFAFKGKNEDLKSIGEKLNVATVLEGSVRRSGERLRIAARLVSAKDGYQVWTQTFDRRLTDIIAVQEEIASAVVAALRVTLMPGLSVESHRKSTSPEAYRLYLKVKATPGTVRSLEDLRRNLKELRSAVDLDPKFAAAWAMLASSEISVADRSDDTRDAQEGRKRAFAAAEKAIALDSELADGYGARGFLRYTIAWDWAGAEADLGRALELDPGNAGPYVMRGKLLASHGKLDEAVEYGRRATEVEPLSTWAWCFMSEFLKAAERPVEARRAAARALELEPGNQMAHFEIGDAWLIEGNPAAALAEFRQAEGMWRAMGLAIAEHRLGHARESQEALDEVIRTHGRAAAYQIAWAFAWRDERTKAFEWLDTAYAEHDGGLADIKFDSISRKLRGDPRYAALLKKLNLPAEN